MIISISKRYGISIITRTQVSINETQVRYNSVFM